MKSEQDVFCVFEGGGAKGVAHVGFLTALDDHSTYSVRGYAGTSAGAVVAALAAAGWKGRELFEEVDGVRQSVALQYLNTKHGERISSLSDFIEPKEWYILSFLRKYLNNANTAHDQQTTRDVGNDIRTYLIRYLAFLSVLFAASVVMSFFGSMLLWAILALAALCFAVPVCAALAYLSGRYTGFASMTRPEYLIESLLQKKIPNPPSGQVTFKDIHDVTGHALKIVASDLENGNIKLFSAETSPDVSVAKAVTASACIPLIFKPVVIEIKNQPRCSVPASGGSDLR